jgi:NAD(P)-dependent dehydrogenase (short-subunit alcohol dehydrogenase family)
VETVYEAMHGRVALVTGGTRGIGRAIAAELAAHGVHAVVVGRHATADDAIGDAGLAVRADLAVDADLERLVADTLERFGRLDFLVNNAAQFETTPTLDPNVTTFDRMWAVNVRAPFRLTKLAVPAIVATGGGAIVNISSGAAVHPPPPGPDAPPPIHPGPEYGVTKAALDRLTTGVAAELLDRGVGAVGIRVRYTMTEGNVGRRFAGLEPSDALPMSATAKAVLRICSAPLQFTGQVREPYEFTTS